MILGKHCSGRSSLARPTWVHSSCLIQIRRLARSLQSAVLKGLASCACSNLLTITSASSMRARKRAFKQSELFTIVADVSSR